MSFAGRIIYNSINLDFIRPWLRFDIQNVNRVDTLVASSGIEEDLEYYDIDMIRAVSQTLTGEEVDQLQQFYEFVKDGSSFELLRDRGLGMSMGLEGKSFNDNNEVGVTFNRALTTDSSYYTDPSTGFLTVVNTVDIARFPLGRFGSGVIVEGARTNLITDPSDLGTNWVNVGAVNTVNLNTTETEDPVDTNLADKITFGAVPNPERFNTSTAISTNDGVYSLLAKSPNGDSTIQLTLKDSSGATLQASGDLTVKPFDSTNNVGNGFQKFEVAFNNGGTNANNWRVETTGTEGDIVYVCGHQLEVGADTLFPSRTIGFASSTSITRAAETLVKATANVLNTNEGSVMLWFNPPYAFDKGPDAFFFEVDDINANSTIAIRLLATGNYNIVRRISNSSTALFNDSSVSGSAITANSFDNHVALTWSTDANSHNLYFNGALIKNFTHSQGNYSELSTNFGLGVGVGGNLPSFCAIDDYLIRNDQLNASRVQAIYNAGRGLGEKKNRFASMKLVDRKFDPIRRIGTNRWRFILEAREVIS